MKAKAGSKVFDSIMRGLKGVDMEDKRYITTHGTDMLDKWVFIQDTVSQSTIAVMDNEAMAKRIVLCLNACSEFTDGILGTDFVYDAVQECVARGMHWYGNKDREDIEIFKDME
jgi:hypothetical protein